MADEFLRIENLVKTFGTNTVVTKDIPANAVPINRPVEGKSMPEQMPSPAAPAPRTVDSRWASHRSTPFAGTATTSWANGSASGSPTPAAGPIKGLFGPESLTWRVDREAALFQTSVGIPNPRGAVEATSK